MKNIKCPLCGGVPQLTTKQIDEIEVCQILCECGLGTEVNEYWLDPKDAPKKMNFAHGRTGKSLSPSSHLSCGCRKET